MKTSSHVGWTAASAGIITFNREIPLACIVRLFQPERALLLLLTKFAESSTVYRFSKCVCLCVTCSFASWLD